MFYNYWQFECSNLRRQKYLQRMANSADPDQKEPSYLGLHCLRGPFCPKTEENFSICCADPDQKEPSYLGLHCLLGTFCAKTEENFSICCVSSFN